MNGLENRPEGSTTLAAPPSHHRHRNLLRTAAPPAPPEPTPRLQGLRTGAHASHATASTPVGDPARHGKAPGPGGVEHHERFWEAHPFCGELWACAEDVYTEVLHHPFIRELQAGTLSTATFCRYQVQDILYLRSFARALDKAASKAPRSEWSRLLRQRATRAREYEQDIAHTLPPELQVPQRSNMQTARSTACREYVGLLQSAATFRSFAETVAALLPCHWFYAELGPALLREGSDRPEFQEWIDSFAAPEYSESLRALLSVMEQTAQNLRPSQRESLKRIFRRAAQMELFFWDSAYDAHCRSRDPGAPSGAAAGAA